MSDPLFESADHPSAENELDFEIRMDRSHTIKNLTTKVALLNMQEEVKIPS